MDRLNLRLATDGDLTAVARLRDDAARWMLGQGITGQWRPGELTEEHFRLAVKRGGEVWIAESGERMLGAWEVWWEDEAAWGPQPPVVEATCTG